MKPSRKTKPVKKAKPTQRPIAVKTIRYVDYLKMLQGRWLPPGWE